MKVRTQSRVAFQGERGAFSEQAALELLGHDITLVPQPTFEATFAAVADDLADYILTPIENSLAGSVHRAYDLLLDSELSIIGEVVIPIVLNLIALPGASLESIQAVESHPVALAQCERFFSAHPWIGKAPAEDTAGSVRAMVSRGDQTRASIASARAAEIYGGVILREHLEDDSENYTRFLLLSDLVSTAETRNKLSLVFQLPDLPGSLYRALEPFARRGLNLMKIESRPLHVRPCEYRFYLDLRARPNDPGVTEAISELEKLAVNLRILGSYQSADSIACKTSKAQ
jgi:prephenate dehydratase